MFIHFYQTLELSLQEFKTAKRMAQELNHEGLDVTENVEGTGVVAIMKNGQGPPVMMRADMDGLPVPEKSGLCFNSRAKRPHGWQCSTCYARFWS
ncbi:MAG: metal-dependent amidase/aminoacylase/carboxypeptidase family protein [Flavobacteriales bacterium]